MYHGLNERRLYICAYKRIYERCISFHLHYIASIGPPHPTSSAVAVRLSIDFPLAIFDFDRLLLPAPTPDYHNTESARFLTLTNPTANNSLQTTSVESIANISILYFVIWIELSVSSYQAANRSPSTQAYIHYRDTTFGAGGMHTTVVFGSRHAHCKVT